MKVGRPLKFPTVEDLQRQINDYFNSTPVDEWMITGLAVSLDTSRKVLMEYEDTRPEYSNAIKRAKRKIEWAYERRGLKVGNAFDIFRLKNMGWKDQHQTDVTSGGKPIPLLGGKSDVQSDDSDTETSETNQED